MCLKCRCHNVNDIEDDCDDEVSKEHADDLLGVDESGSIPSTFDPNLLLWIQKNLMCSFNKSEYVVDLEFMLLDVLF